MFLHIFVDNLIHITSTQFENPYNWPDRSSFGRSAIQRSGLIAFELK
jgi:hypothetical protein